MAQATAFLSEDVNHPKPWMSEEATRGTVTMGGCPEIDAAKTKGSYLVTESPISRDPLPALRVIDSSAEVILSEVRCRLCPAPWPQRIGILRNRLVFHFDN